MHYNPEAIGCLNETQSRLRQLGIVVGGGSLAITSAVAVDGWLSKRLWVQTANQFLGIDPNAQEQSLSMGGLGVTCGKELADDAQRFLPGAAMYATYSNNGFSLNQLGKKFHQQMNESALHLDGGKVLHFNLHSLAGPVGLETYRTAETKHLGLGKIFLNCSPFANNDAYLGRYTNLLGVVQWPVGPGSKLLFSFARSMLEHKPVPDAWQQAKYDAVNGCSPYLFLSQLAALRSIDLMANHESYKPLIGPETKAYYCRPQDPLKDMVVNTAQASERYANFFDTLGVPFEDVLVPNVGHAESSPTADFLANRMAC